MSRAAVASRLTWRVSALGTLLSALAACDAGLIRPQTNLPDIDLVGAGDIAACTGWSEATAGLLDAMAGIVITMGDNAYPNGTPEDYERCYHPTWGRHRDRTLPTPGNHDYRVPGAPGYFGYFGAAAGVPGKGYYSFDLEGWHVVAYNSAIDIDDSSEQIEWLRMDLEAAPTQCILAYGYHPRFSSGWHGDEDVMEAAWSVFYEFGVDVVLSGHDHDFERFSPLDEARKVDPNHGIRQFVVGTGGGGIRAIEQPSGGSEFRLAGSHEHHGVIAIDLRPAGYAWEFITVAGNVADRGSDVCR